MSKLEDALNYTQKGIVKTKFLNYETNGRPATLLFFNVKMPNLEQFNLKYMFRNFKIEHCNNNYKWHIISVNEVLELFHRKEIFKTISELFVELLEKNEIWIESEYSIHDIKNPNMGCNHPCYNLSSNKNISFNFQTGTLHNVDETEFKHVLLVGVPEK